MFPSLSMTETRNTSVRRWNEGNLGEETTWFRFTVWGCLVAVCNDYFKTGGFPLDVGIALLLWHRPAETTILRRRTAATTGSRYHYGGARSITALFVRLPALTLNCTQPRTLSVKFSASAIPRLKTRWVLETRQV